MVELEVMLVSCAAAAHCPAAVPVLLAISGRILHQVFPALCGARVPRPISRLLPLEAFSAASGIWLACDPCQRDVVAFS